MSPAPCGSIGAAPRMYRKLRLCSNNGGYEAIPDPPLRLDLRQARSALEHVGIAVVDARVMLVIGTDPEVTLSRTGRLLFKTQDPAAADRVFQQLHRLLELPGTLEDDARP